MSQRDKDYYRRNCEKLKGKNREYYHSNRDRLCKRRRELAPLNREKNNERERQRYAKLRGIIMSHYGRQCACCGETELLFLEIDHVKNDGHAHRKRIGRSGKSLCLWLKKEGFPSGFQILCSNCNQGKKRNGGICPHKKNL